MSLESPDSTYKTHLIPNHLPVYSWHGRKRKVQRGKKCNTILLSFINFSNIWSTDDYGGNRGMFDMPFVLRQNSIVNSLVHDLELFEK